MRYKELYKNISVVALGTALISLPLFTACESDVVDLSPVDKFSDLTAYGTPERCELSMVGAYDAAQCGMYINADNGWQRGYPFGAASIEQAEMRGEDMNLSAVFYDYTIRQPIICPQQIMLPCGKPLLKPLTAIIRLWKDKSMPVKMEYWMKLLPINIKESVCFYEL